MKVKRLILFVLISVIFSGLTTIVFLSVFDKDDTIRLFDQAQVKVPEGHRAASISEGTILLLLAIGVIGVLGVSRKKKDIGDCDPKKETTRRLYSSDSE